jgi:hypothetical protein
MPKTVELEEGEYNRLQALHGVAVKIAGNPQSRKLFEQAHKLVVPEAATPLLDQEKTTLEPLNALKTELSTEIAALKKEREDEKREATLAALARRQSDGIAQLRRQGYTDEGVAAVQKLMEDKGLLEVEDAVAIFEKHNPPATPATPGGGITGGHWNFTDTTADSDKSIVDMLASKGQNEAVVDRMANSALMEIRGLRR